MRLFRRVLARFRRPATHRVHHHVAAVDRAVLRRILDQQARLGRGPF